MSVELTSTLRGRPNPDWDHWFCQFWINSWAALVFLTAITTCAPASANCLAISRPIPLVEPVTMQVRSLTGGKGIGLCKWLAEILWNSISYITFNQPLNHSIHPNASFFFFCFGFCFGFRFRFASSSDDDDEEDDVVAISNPLFLSLSQQSKQRNFL